MAITPVEHQPGFCFHPTDQELVTHYLRRKVHGLHDHHAFIPEVDLYKHEPWELPDKSFSPSSDEPGAKVECYLFVPRGRKHANGCRMNRATQKGFWKSTGKDRPILHHHVVVGMKKTLVYHLGRAPKGVRTNWVMHEYRIQNDDMAAIQDTYALCRVFKKKAMTPSLDMPGGADANMYMDGAQSVPAARAGANSDGVHLVPAGADADNDDSSLMQLICDNAWCSSLDANMDESWMKLVSVGADDNMDESWMSWILSVPAQQEGAGEGVELLAQQGALEWRLAEREGDEAGAVPDTESVVVVTAAGPGGDVGVARMDDGTAGLEVVAGGGRWPGGGIGTASEKSKGGGSPRGSRESPPESGPNPPTHRVC